MAQYIDKDALVAEIERRMKDNFHRALVDGSASKAGAKIEDEYLLSLMNTLEVKEVDLEKKKMEWIEQLCKYFKANYLYVRGHESFISDFRNYAKNLK